MPKISTRFIKCHPVSPAGLTVDRILSIRNKLVRYDHFLDERGYIPWSYEMPANN